MAGDPFSKDPLLSFLQLIIRLVYSENHIRESDAFSVIILRRKKLEKNNALC